MWIADTSFSIAMTLDETSRTLMCFWVLQNQADTSPLTGLEKIIRHDRLQTLTTETLLCQNGLSPQSFLELNS